MTNAAGAQPTFFGETLDSRALAGVRLTETRHAGRDRVAPHAHAAPFVTFVLAGGYEETLRGKSTACVAGSAVLHEAGEVHEDRFGVRATHLLNVEWSADGPSAPALSPRLARGAAPRRIAATLLDELRRGSAASRLVVESALAEIAVLGLVEEPDAASRRRPAPWLRRVEERIRDEYRDPPGLAELAHEAGVHRSHLARSFRACYGRTIGELVRELRIEWARERLRRGAPIADVATEAGFADQSHMTRWFARTLGRTPARVCAS